jgi:hypothetical protein
VRRYPHCLTYIDDNVVLYDRGQGLGSLASGRRPQQCDRSCLRRLHRIGDIWLYRVALLSAIECASHLVGVLYGRILATLGVGDLGTAPC